MQIEHLNNMAGERHDADEKPAPCGGLRPSDRPLDPGREPPLGAHMVTPRRGYTHHGIYVGGGSVVQYGGLSWGLRRGPVEEVSLSTFSHGRPVWVRVVESRWFDQDEVVRRARQRLGEDRYSVLTNNCEHFCEWCVRGQHRSYQVDDRIADYRGLLLKFIELLARLRPRRRDSTAADCLYLGEQYQRAID
jgi:Lecithin retinol acyltransferase